MRPLFVTYASQAGVSSLNFGLTAGFQCLNSFLSQSFQESEVIVTEIPKTFGGFVGELFTNRSPMQEANSEAPATPTLPQPKLKPLATATIHSRRGSIPKDLQEFVRKKVVCPQCPVIRGLLGLPPDIKVFSAWNRVPGTAYKRGMPFYLDGSAGSY
jgi:hypothetical protein